MIVYILSYVEHAVTHEVEHHGMNKALIPAAYYVNGKLTKPTGFTSVASWKRALVSEIANYEKVLRIGVVNKSPLTNADRAFYSLELVIARKLVAAIDAGEVK